MSIDTEMNPLVRTSSTVRSDFGRANAMEPKAAGEFWSRPRRIGVLASLAIGFVLLGGGRLDLGLTESRLGLASQGSLGPFGQVFGGWDPSIWIGRLLPSLIWSWGEGFLPTSASVRWPEAIAGILLGFILARRAVLKINGRAALLIGVCWFGSLGLIDRSSVTELDFVTGLWTVAALDRILGRGSDIVAGTFAGLAFLCGGWPAVVLIVLATVVIGRSAAGLNWRLLSPPAIVAAAWSACALSVAPAEAWAAALTLPLTQKPSWLLCPAIFMLGLPWSPLVALVLSREVRSSWTPKTRGWVTGWLQIAGASLLVGTFIPGLASAAGIPTLAGLAIIAGAASDRMLFGIESSGAKRWLFGASVLLALIWSFTMILAGGYLVAAVAYYRLIAATLILLSVPAAGLAIFSAMRRDIRGAWLSIFVLSVSLKMAHFGYYAPEWNYRMSQGPWGRAIGQWVPPRWPIYTTTTWRADLAFATGHPVLQLLSPQHLQYQPGEARYVLLHAAEFEHWPEKAPKLMKVAEFRDEFDAARVLARTDGPLPWTRPTLLRDQD